MSFPFFSSLLSKADFATFKYPAALGYPPFDKWILFEAKTGRHILRNSIITEGAAPDRTLASSALYLSPDALTSSLELSWDSTDLGPFVGAAIEAMAQTGKNMFNMKFGSMADARNSLSDVLKSVTTKTGAAKETGLHGILDSFKEAIRGQVLVGVNSLVGEGTTQVITGTRVNPRTDTYFDSQDYREHSLEFMLIPRTRDEALAIDRIIHFFQFYSLPSYFGSEALDAASVGSFLMGFPFEFEITMYGGNQPLEHVNKIGRSVLKSVSVNHAAGDKVAFIKDNGEYFPLATTLSLSFQEVRLLGRDSKEINRGDINQKSLKEE